MKRCLLLWMASSLTLTLALTSLPASAAEPDAIHAEALFHQARLLVDGGDLERGCPLFGESLRLQLAPGTILNWADCEERLGHIAHAEQLYTQAADVLPNGDERSAYARARAAALSPRVPRITFVKTSATPAGTRVREGATEVRDVSFGLPLPFEPGPHRLVVEAEGHRAHEVSLELREGERLELAVAPGAPLPAREAVVAPLAPGAVPPSSSRRIWGWGMAGGGLASILAGGAAGIVVAGYASTYKEHCMPTCDDEGRRAAEAGRPWAVVSPVALVTGALLVGAGLYLLVSQR